MIFIGSFIVVYILVKSLKGSKKNTRAMAKQTKQLKALTKQMKLKNQLEIRANEPIDPLDAGLGWLLILGFVCIGWNLIF